MEKEFVPYEQALELKELGFDEPCIACWSNRKSKNYYLYFGGIEYVEDGGYVNPMKGTTISAPLYQQAFRWFRQKYGLIGWVEGKKVYKYCIKNSIPNDGQINFSPFKTNEEAELACIKKLIEIVIQHEL